MAEPAVKITVLGSGTSTGVPTIGCHCDVCTSTDPRDKRLRPSILLSYDGRHVLIDATPDFRAQALRTGIDRLDAILFTHEHADHILGLDDVRPFNFHQRGRIPIYASERTMAAIHRAFRYVFDGAKRGIRRAATGFPHCSTARHSICSASSSRPSRSCTARRTIYGFRFGDAAYLTDHSEIPEASLDGCAAWTCCSSMRCVTSRIPRIPPWTFHRDGRTAGAEARLLHAHLPRPGARAYRGAPAAAHPAGL